MRRALDMCIGAFLIQAIVLIIWIMAEAVVDHWKR